jgi:hypothetical protein
MPIIVSGDIILTKGKSEFLAIWTAIDVFTLPVGHVIINHQYLFLHYLHSNDHH